MAPFPVLPLQVPRHQRSQYIPLNTALIGTQSCHTNAFGVFPPPTSPCSPFALQMSRGTAGGLRGASVARRHGDQGAAADGATASRDGGVLARHGRQAETRRFRSGLVCCHPQTEEPVGGAVWLSVIGQYDVLMDANDGWL